MPPCLCTQPVAVEAGCLVGQWPSLLPAYSIFSECVNSANSPAIRILLSQQSASLPAGGTEVEMSRSVSCHLLIHHDRSHGGAEPE